MPCFRPRMPKAIRCGTRLSLFIQQLAPSFSFDHAEVLLELANASVTGWHHMTTTRMHASEANDQLTRALLYSVMQDQFWMPRCCLAARGIALVAVREVGRVPLSESRVTREGRPVGSAPNTFLLRALSLVVLLDVPLMTTEQTQEPTHRIPPSLLDRRLRQAAHHV